MTGIVADGAGEYLRALEAEAAEKIRALEGRVAAARDLATRDALAAEIRLVRRELDEKRKRAARSLF